MSRMRNPEQKEYPTAFEVSQAELRDAVDIAQIQFDSWLKTYPNAEAGLTEEDIRHKLGDLEKRTERWRAKLENKSPSEQIFVIKQEGKIIGFCKGEKREIENHVDALYLDPQAEGIHAGSTLFRSILDWLGSEKSCVLEVTSYNKRAIDFYHRFGFEDVGKGESILIADGKTMPTTVMRKPIE